MGIDTTGGAEHGGFSFPARRLQCGGIPTAQAQRRDLAEPRRQRIDAPQKQGKIHIAVGAVVVFVHQPRLRSQSHLLRQCLCRQAGQISGGEVHQNFTGAVHNGIQPMGAVTGTDRHRPAADEAGALHGAGQLVAICVQHIQIIQPPNRRGGLQRQTGRFQRRRRAVIDKQGFAASGGADDLRRHRLAQRGAQGFQSRVESQLDQRRELHRPGDIHSEGYQRQAIDPQKPTLSIRPRVTGAEDVLQSDVDNRHRWSPVQVVGCRQAVPPPEGGGQRWRRCSPDGGSP